MVNSCRKTLKVPRYIGVIGAGYKEIKARKAVIGAGRDISECIEDGVCRPRYVAYASSGRVTVKAFFVLEGEVAKVYKVRVDCEAMNPHEYGSVLRSLFRIVLNEIMKCCKKRKCRCEWVELEEKLLSIDPLVEVYKELEQT